MGLACGWQCRDQWGCCQSYKGSEYSSACGYVWGSGELGRKDEGVLVYLELGASVGMWGQSDTVTGYRGGGILAYISHHYFIQYFIKDT